MGNGTIISLDYTYTSFQTFTYSYCGTKTCCAWSVSGLLEISGTSSTTSKISVYPTGASASKSDSSITVTLTDGSTEQLSVAVLRSNVRIGE